MAATETIKISAQEHYELCCVYACLALHDAGIQVTVNIADLTHLGRKNCQAHQG